MIYVVEHAIVKDYGKFTGFRWYKDSSHYHLHGAQERTRQLAEESRYARIVDEDGYLVEEYHPHVQKS